MAQLRMASGGAAWDAPVGYHETGVVVAGGETSTYETWGDYRSLRWASAHTRSGQTSRSGFDGTAAWSAGPDGVVRVDTSPKALAEARLGAYLSNLGYYFPDRFPARFEHTGRRGADGKTYDTVRVTPKESVPIDLWLDAETHRLQRLSGMDGATPFRGVVDRYEVIKGAWVPYAIRQFVGDQEIVQTLTSIEFVEPPAERLARPATGPQGND